MRRLLDQAQPPRPRDSITSPTTPPSSTLSISKGGHVDEESVFHITLQKSVTSVARPLIADGMPVRVAAAAKEDAHLDTIHAVRAASEVDGREWCLGRVGSVAVGFNGDARAEMFMPVNQSRRHGPVFCSQTPGCHGWKARDRSRSS